ncbi:MAG: ABC transporter substrate-binding protein [Microthrixaceae bacterium]
MAKRVTRRDFITRTGAAVGGFAIAPAVLAACGGSESSSSGSGGEGGGGGGDLAFDNWTLYIDKPNDDLYGTGGTLDEFQKSSGTKIAYTENYNDNNEYFAKIQPLLSKGEPIGPTIIAPTFWMAGRLLQLGWLDQLPLDKIPNAKNLITNLQKPPSDPTGEFSLPWQSGMAGIAYNQAVTGREIRSVADLWDPAFKGKIGMLTEMRDTVGLIAMSEGIDLAKPEFERFQPAFAKLDEQVQNGQIRQFTGNDYVDDLEQGNYAACIGWSGDVVQLSKSNPDIKFVVPESGGTLWFDTMVLPKGASQEKIDAAAKWMDYVYDPANAARITETVQYISPVQGVQDELRKRGGDAAALADSQLLFPDATTLSNLQTWGTLDEAQEQLFDEEFARISGA